MKLKTKHTTLINYVSYSFLLLYSVDNFSSLQKKLKEQHSFSVPENSFYDFFMYSWA